MKKIFLLFFCLVFITKVSAQKIEINVFANTGLFHYGGNSAASTSYINVGSGSFQSYTNNPYGSKNGLSYGIGLKAQHVGKSGFIFGIEASYEILRSKINIDHVNPYYDTLLPWYDITYPTVQSSGQTFLQNTYFNFSPFFGYRFKFKKVKIDVLPGIDLAANITSYDKGKATGVNGLVYETDYKLNNSPLDVRLRYNAVANYGRFGVYVSYAHGLINLDKKIANFGPTGLNSELLRFGLSYKLN